VTREEICFATGSHQGGYRPPGTRRCRCRGSDLPANHGQSVMNPPYNRALVLLTVSLHRAELTRHSPPPARSGGSIGRMKPAPAHSRDDERNLRPPRRATVGVEKHRRRRWAGSPRRVPEYAVTTLVGGPCMIMRAAAHSFAGQRMCLPGWLAHRVAHGRALEKEETV